MTRSAQRTAVSNPRVAGRSGGGDRKRQDADASNQRRSVAARRAYQRRTQRSSVRGRRQPVIHVTRRPRSLTRGIPFVALIIGLLTVGLGATLWLSTKAAEDSYQISAARVYNQTLSEEKSALQRDVEAGNSPPKLAEEAGKLGMVPAKDVPKIVVNPDGTGIVVGKPKPAEGAQMPSINRQPGGQGPAGGTPTRGPAGERQQPVGQQPVGRQQAAPSATPPNSTPPNSTPPQHAGAQPEVPAQASGEQLVPVTRPAPMPAGAPNGQPQ